MLLRKTIKLKPQNCSSGEVEDEEHTIMPCPNYEGGRVITSKYPKLLRTGQDLPPTLLILNSREKFLPVGLLIIRDR